MRICSYIPSSLFSAEERRLKIGLSIVLALTLVLMGFGFAPVSAASPAALGGGTIAGSPGLVFTGSASQFGFYADAVGGHFECLMAGFSGGFEIPGTPFAVVLLMQVRGSVDPGSLEVVPFEGSVHGVSASGLKATFTGVSVVRIVGKAADGSVMTVVMELPYIVEAVSGDAGVGILHLDHPDLELHTGGLVATGTIVVRG
jgi:hypothetical protein